MNAKPSLLSRQCEEAVRLGVAFLLDHLQPDGSYSDVIDDLVAHYKTPFALKELGYSQEARKTLGYVLNTFLDEDGDLQRPGRKTDNAVYAAHLSHYMNSWVVRGAVALDQNEATAGMQAYLKTQQDAETGGVYTSRGSTQAGVGTTSAFGIASLDAGDTPAARRAAEFLMFALDNQPTEGAFHLCFSGRQPLLAFSAEDAAFSVIRMNEQAQAYWVLGMAMAFLTQLADESGGTHFLDAARRFMKLFTACASDKCSVLASGKVGWGIKTLYQHTGDRDLLDVAADITRKMLALQWQDGRWSFAERDAEETVSAVTIDVTTELLLWTHYLGELFD